MGNISAGREELAHRDAVPFITSGLTARTWLRCAICGDQHAHHIGQFMLVDVIEITLGT